MKFKLHVVWVGLLLVVLAGCGGAASQDMQAAYPVIRFVQVTDTHLGQTAQHDVTAEKVMAAVKKYPEPLTFVVHTGDIIDDGKYDKCLALFRRIFSGLAVPFYPVAGNNDFDLHAGRTMPAEHVQACAAQWKEHIGPFWEFADYPGVRVVAATTEPVIHGVDVGADLFAWLETTLSQAQQKKLDVIVFTHSPIMGSVRNDTFYSPYPEAVYRRLETLLNTYEVKAVVAGHFHVSGLYACGDVPVFVSEASQRGGLAAGSYRVYEYDPNTDRLTYQTVTAW